LHNDSSVAAPCEW